MKSSLTVDKNPTRRRVAIPGSLPVALVIAALTARVSQAAGQPSAKDAPIAQALFNAARTLMDADRFAEACPKLAESQRLDPASGTLLNLAVCHEKEGKTASAWAEYNDLLATREKEGSSERQRIAAERIRELEPRLARITILLSDQDLVGDSVIALDTVQIRRAAVGVAMPVDPGPHLVEVSAPGKERWSLALEPLEAGTSRLVRAPALMNAPANRPTVRPSVVQPETFERSPNRRRRAAYVSGAVGLAALAISGYLGYLAKTEWDRRNDRCLPDCSNTSAIDAGNRAATLAHVADATVAFAVIGGVIGAYLFVTSAAPSGTPPGGPPAGPALAITGAGMAISYRGEF